MAIFYNKNKKNNNKVKSKPLELRSQVKKEKSIITYNFLFHKCTDWPMQWWLSKREQATILLKTTNRKEPSRALKLQIYGAEI
jgi:hypothetical protein